MQVCQCFGLVFLSVSIYVNMFLNNLIFLPLIVGNLRILVLTHSINVYVDRMPVILGDKGSTDAWLNGSKTDMLLKPYENPDLVRAF